VEERAPAERIADANVPLLVVFGMEDDIVDPDAADEWAKGVPRARVVKMRGVGHSPHWERPREVIELLLDYAR
jgi:pimeloyl-ACP methyl ester carboxylesterase